MKFKDFFIIQEISKEYLNKIPMDMVNLPWSNIFGEKLRIKIDYTPDYSFLNTNEIIFIKDKNAFFKTKDEPKKNRLKLSKAIGSKETEENVAIKKIRKEQSIIFKKLLDKNPEEMRALQFHMRIPISMMLEEIEEVGFKDTFYAMYKSSKTQIKEIIDYLLGQDIGNPTWWKADIEYENKMKDYSLMKNSSEKYSLIISRVPVDVLRASDHATIISCLSPAGRGRKEEGQHFNDLMQTCLAGAGIVYVLPETNISDEDLQKPELFKDVERQIEGHVPMARLLVRQFKNNDGKQIMVPEVRVFGSMASIMKEVVYKDVVKILKNLQGVSELDYKEWYMAGSKYIDTETNEEDILLRFSKA